MNVEKLVDAISTDWAKKNFENKFLPEIAKNALQNVLNLSAYDSNGVQKLIFDMSLKRKGFLKFGAPGLILHNDENLQVGLVKWDVLATKIHNHSFYGSLITLLVLQLPMLLGLQFVPRKFVLGLTQTESRGLSMSKESALTVAVPFFRFYRKI